MRIIFWRRGRREAPPAPCPWCQDHQSLRTCTTCLGLYRACPDCALGMVCPTHGRFWLK